MISRATSLSFIDELGRRVTHLLDYSLSVFMMSYLSLRAIIVDQNQNLRSLWAVILSQIYFTGVQAMIIIGTMAVTTSSIIVLQTSSKFNILGGSSSIGQIMVVLIVREIAPLLTALVVIARSGTAVATELGNMRVNREIEAYESMGINPLSYIIFPRLVGGIISVLCLATYFIFIAIVAGYFFTKIFMSMSLSYYLEAIIQNLTIADAYVFFIKNVYSGALIFSICCYQGLSVSQGPQEVPQATTVAVVNSIIYVIAFNFTISILFYLNQLFYYGVI